MKRSIYLFTLLAMSVALFIAGCSTGTLEKPARESAAKGKSAAPGDPVIEANLAKLTPQDRKLAEAQKWCAVQEENPLGEMAVPYKVMVKGQPVFLCCKGCKSEAEAAPDKTLAKVAELKTNAGGGAK